MNGPINRAHGRYRRDEVIRQINEGKTYSQIAKSLGMTRCQVSGYVFRAKHGTTRRPRAGAAQ